MKTFYSSTTKAPEYSTLGNADSPLVNMRMPVLFAVSAASSTSVPVLRLFLCSLPAATDVLNRLSTMDAVSSTVEPKRVTSSQLRRTTAFPSPWLYRFCLVVTASVFLLAAKRPYFQLYIVLAAPRIPANRMTLTAASRPSPAQHPRLLVHSTTRTRAYTGSYPPHRPSVDVLHASQLCNCGGAISFRSPETFSIFGALFPCGVLFQSRYPCQLVAIWNNRATDPGIALMHRLPTMHTMVYRGVPGSSWGGRSNAVCEHCGPCYVELIMNPTPYLAVISLSLREGAPAIVVILRGFLLGTPRRYAKSTKDGCNLIQREYTMYTVGCMGICL